jgi:hypothetical protein
MPGYQLVERALLAPEKPNGVYTHPEEIGVLDFLRELSADEFSILRAKELCVIGLEEVLYAAREESHLVAQEIRRILRESARDLERKAISVQVVFRGALMRGDRFWVVYRNHELPVGQIFGSPPPVTDENGNRFYRTNFNLSQL